MGTEHDAAATGRAPAARAASAEAPVVALEAVRFGYPGGPAVVDGVTAGLAAGRVTALIGPNGAGKSTLVRLMLGQLKPWSGRVRVAGREAAGLGPRELARRLSYVPQRPAVSFAFTVRQVVEMGRYAGGADAAAVAWALSLCGLEGLADRVFAHLSGGQQQRVLLARAVAQSAGGAAMLLDEPASGLDLAHLHRTLARLRGRAADGLAVLVVLHDLNLASAYADEVWLMDGGRLAAAGPRAARAGVRRAATGAGCRRRPIDLLGRPRRGSGGRRGLRRGYTVEVGVAGCGR